MVPVRSGAAPPPPDAAVGGAAEPGVKCYELCWKFTLSIEYFCLEFVEIVYMKLMVRVYVYSI